MEEYDIKEHTHRFAAWAASRAASVKDFRFSVAKGKSWIEAVDGLRDCVCDPSNLPDPKEFDETHRKWRERIIQVSHRPMKHGVAAKLVNIYLKVAVVQCSFVNLPKVKAVHPPIDSVLLSQLRRIDSGFLRRRSLIWTQFGSKKKKKVIKGIQDLLGEGEALWKIEKYWRGHR